MRKLWVKFKEWIDTAKFTDIIFYGFLIWFALTAILSMLAFSIFCIVLSTKDPTFIYQILST